MKAKVAKLQEAIAQHEQEASGVLFETDDPTKNQHKYLLRAILWHDGFLTPGKHLYAYVRGEDSWWRVQEESAFKVGYLITTISESPGVLGRDPGRHDWAVHRRRPLPPRIQPRRAASTLGR